MRNKTLRDTLFISLYAALIYVAIAALKIPIGSQMFHLGNALVVVGVLLFGAKKGALAASLGLGIFDLLGGYASVVWVTILESLIVCVVLHLLFEKALKKVDSIQHVVLSALVAAVVKVLLNFIKYTLRGMIGGALPAVPAMSAALLQITGSYTTAIGTAVAAPILYFAFKPIFKRLYK